MGETLGNLLPFGPMALVAQRAADVIAVLQAPGTAPYHETICNVNNVLKRYNKEVTGADFDSLKDVTRKLHKVFTAPNAHAATILLNDVLTEYASPPRLDLNEDGAWQVSLDSKEQSSWVEGFAASSAFAFATLLAEKGQNPCKLCASPSCRRPFVDLGKGGGQSYCSSRCATRERVAAYRRRTTQ